ncbi:MAG: PPC domain-containing protein [Fuerstiella sp.]|nr:PPC domain-containing protein [Fuerstiella sp.]
MPRCVLFCVLLVGALGTVDQANAQAVPSKALSSTHIFPAGAQRGTDVSVRIGAECSPPGTNFSMTGEGLATTSVLTEELLPLGEPSPRRLPTLTAISYPREWDGNISIAEDAPLGPVYWRLNSAFGGTTSRPFIVGDLPELIETESNSTVQTAEPITLPVTINGQVSGERDADYFRFHLNAGEFVVCEVMAGRIASPLDPLVELLDGDGSPLAARQIYVGSDPVLTYRAEADGEYLLRVANVTFHGSPAHVYRVDVTNQPRIHFAVPTGGQAGTTREVELNLLAGTETHVVRRKIDFPEQPGEFVYRDTELNSSVLLVADDSPNSAEIEPNDDLPSAMLVTLPQTVTGRFLSASDEDWFRFVVQKDNQLQITCQAFPPGTAAMPNVTVTDDEGKTLANAQSVTSESGICRILWTAPISGRFYVRIRDLRKGSRGGSDFLYRLSVVPAKSDFTLKLGSDNISVVQGSKSKVDVSVERLGGFNGSIDLAFEGLPDGCTITSAQIPAGANSVTAELAVTEDVPVSSTPVRLTGRAEIDGHMLERVARGRHLGVDSEGVSIAWPTVEQLHLTVLHKPLFRLVCSEAYHYGHRGTVFPYPMEVERLDGFDGKIIVQRADRQNSDMDGIQIWNAVIPSGSSTVDVPIYMPESMHINVQPQSQLYSQAFAHFKDKHGQDQSILVVAEKRNMMRTLPPVVKLQAVDQQVSAECGGTVKCRLHLERTSNFPGPMEVELLEPTDGFTTEPFKIPGGESDVQVEIRVPTKLEPGALIPLVFRARGDLDERVEVITEASVAVRVE